MAIAMAHPLPELEDRLPKSLGATLLQHKQALSAVQQGRPHKDLQHTALPEDCLSTTPGSSESAFSLLPQQRQAKYSLGVVELQHDYLELSTEYADLDKANKALQWESAEKQRRIESLTLKAAEHQVAYENLRGDLDRLRQIGEMIGREQEVTSDLKRKVDAAYGKEHLVAKSLQEANGKLQREIDDHASKAVGLEGLVARLTREKAQATTQIDEQRLAIQALELQEKQRRGPADLDAITRTCEMLRQENRTLAWESVESQNRLESIISEAADSQQQVQHLHRQRSALLERVEELITQSSEQKEANEALEQEKEGMLESIAAFNAERREQQRALREMQQLVNDLSAQQIDQQRAFERLAREKADILEEKGELSVRVTVLEERAKSSEQLEAQRSKLHVQMEVERAMMREHDGAERSQRLAVLQADKAEQLQQLMDCEVDKAHLQRELKLARQQVSGMAERVGPAHHQGFHGSWSPATTASCRSAWECASVCASLATSPKIISLDAGPDEYVEEDELSEAFGLASVSSWESAL